MMRRSARFDADEARRQLLKEWQNVSALELTTNDYITCCVNSVDLKNRLSNIETDRPDRLHIWLLRVVGALTAPTSMALPCRWRSRPQHQKRTNAPQQKAPLFDHLVGAGEKGFRNRKANRFRGFDVDDEFELGGLIDGQGGRRGAIDNASHVDSGATISICCIIPIADKPALFDQFSVGVDGRNSVARCQSNDLLPAGGEERIATDKKRVGPPLPHGGECGIDLAGRTGIENQQLPAEVAPCLLRFVFHARALRQLRICQHGNQRSTGNKFVQQAKPFADDQHVEPTHSRDIAARPVEATHESLVNRIAASREHDRNRFCHCHRSQYRSATSRRDDHVDLAADQIGRQDRQAIEPILRKTVLDRHVAAIDIAGFTQTTAERCQEVGPVILAKHVQESDHRHRRLLRACCERPRGHPAAEHCHEVAPLHRAHPRPKDHWKYSSSGACVAPKAARSCPLWVNSGQVGRLLAMSALCQKRAHALQQNRQTQPPGCLAVDHRLELGGLNDWQFGWPSPLRTWPVWTDYCIACADMSIAPLRSRRSAYGPNTSSPLALVQQGL